ncbi:uncharacterized protein LOC109090300 isoform X2 [Cyprinus carpio]|nr:uncharacterized protein LOC109090300 isoform X2 [Cyprinus carpio]XP_042619545.1 uncharacterized protein LOC109090300 isoform X2 [Cyprinus carpio]
MEPKIDNRQGGRDERKLSSRTSSLPSLWNDRKDKGKIRSLHPSLSLNSSSIPVLPAAHITQLSKSAPMLMDPFLDASVLLQARAKIHNWLRGAHTGDDDNRQKTLPTLCSKTPKHLAPLDNIYKDGSACSSLEHPLLLKQSSILPISSQSRRRVERILEKSLNLELGTYLDFQDLGSSVIHNTTNDNVISDKKGYTSTKSLTVRKVVKNEIRCKSFKTTENSDFQRKSPSMNCCTFSEGPENITRQIPTVRESCSVACEKQLTALDTGVLEKSSHEKKKPIKMIKRNPSTGKTSIQTNQSFNVLAHRKQSTVKTTNSLKAATQRK